MIQEVNPTGLTIADLIAGSPNHTDTMKWLTHWYSQKIDVPVGMIKEIIIDGNNVFPIFVNDNLEMLLERFAGMYPVLAKASINHVKDMRFNNNDGQSGSKLLRSLVSIPPILKAAVCAFYGKNCFTDKEFLKKFSRLAPKFFTCDNNKI